MAKYKTKWYNGTKYFWTGACRQTDYQGYLEAKQAKLRTYQRYLKDDEDLLL